MNMVSVSEVWRDSRENPDVYWLPLRLASVEIQPMFMLKDDHDESCCIAGLNPASQWDEILSGFDASLDAQNTAHTNEMCWSCLWRQMTPDDDLGLCNGCRATILSPRPARSDETREAGAEVPRHRA